MGKVELELIAVYQEMADHTNPECGKCRPKPYGCCSPHYCDITRLHAKAHWNMDLEETEDYKSGATLLPFMDLKKGCQAPPHTRPSCTLHTCSVSNLGFKIGDRPWTKRYFKLREKIKELELRKYEEQMEALRQEIENPGEDS